MIIMVPAPEPQIGFAIALANLRARYLGEALSKTVTQLRIADIDRDLSDLVPQHCLSALAAKGLRGELVFPVPLILRANPFLLGYYRLLYGYSQKEFYTSASGLGQFKAMEERGTIRPKIDPLIPELANTFCNAGAVLLDGISSCEWSQSLLHDLKLLTLGPQLRGGANVKKGAEGIKLVFEAIHAIVADAATLVTDTRIEVNNTSGRRVLIEFAPDPDIIIREEMRPNVYRQIIAIEVKAGSDFSNIHNRIGEAEKSHQKARQAGYVECWTVVNVDRIDVDTARSESPSTNRFYRISDLANPDGAEYQDFRDRIMSLTSVA
jgi:hypothetical protein